MNTLVVSNTNVNSSYRLRFESSDVPFFEIRHDGFFIKDEKVSKREIVNKFSEWLDTIAFTTQYTLGQYIVGIKHYYYKNGEKICEENLGGGYHSPCGDNAHWREMIDPTGKWVLGVACSKCSKTRVYIDPCDLESHRQIYVMRETLSSSGEVNAQPHSGSD